MLQKGRLNRAESYTASHRFGAAPGINRIPRKFEVDLPAGALRARAAEDVTIRQFDRLVLDRVLVQRELGASPVSVSN